MIERRSRRNVRVGKIRGKRVLVTGGGGFIGSHLIERLVHLGADVTALVRYNSRNSWGFIDDFPRAIRSQVTVVTGDIRDGDTVRNLCRYKDVILHLAALIGIPYSFSNPTDVLQTNVNGTMNILQGSRQYDVSRVVVASTSEVFGSARIIPMNEDHPLSPQSPYAATKIACDKLAESFFKTYHLPVTVLRPFNTYGPRQSMRAVIPTIISQVFHGNVVRLGNTETRRDLTYVTDTADGFILAAVSPYAVGETINLGVGKDWSITELVRIISGLMNKKVEIVTEEERKRSDSTEVYRLLSDNSKANTVLGWRPTVDLEVGLLETIRWLEGNMNTDKVGTYTI